MTADEDAVGSGFNRAPRNVLVAGDSEGDDNSVDKEKLVISRML